MDFTLHKVCKSYATEQYNIPPIVKSVNKYKEARKESKE